MNRTRIFGCALLGATVAMAACQDSVAPGGQLTADEAAALASQLDLVGSDAVDTRTRDHGATGGADGHGTLTVLLDFAVPCPLGGTLRLVGSHRSEVDLQDGWGSASTEATATPSGCGLEVEGGALVVSGGLAYGAAHTVSWPPLAYDGVRHQQGTLDWRRDNGETGVCAVDLSATAQYTDDGATKAGSRVIQGVICGHDVSRSMTWSWAGG